MQHQEFKEWLEQNTRGHEILLLRLWSHERKRIKREPEKQKSGLIDKWSVK